MFPFSLSWWHTHFQNLAKARSLKKGRNRGCTRLESPCKEHYLGQRKWVTISWIKADADTPGPSTSKSTTVENDQSSMDDIYDQLDMNSISYIMWLSDSKAMTSPYSRARMMMTSNQFRSVASCSVNHGCGITANCRLTTKKTRPPAIGIATHALRLWQLTRRHG